MVTDCVGPYDPATGENVGAEAAPLIVYVAPATEESANPDLVPIALTVVVVLTVTVSAKQGELTLFLVEVKQAGVFVMKNLDETEVKRSVASICPSVLFPYARAAVSNLVTQGGFPQFLLPPVNFDALYQRAGDAPPVTKS